jgi:hypothetical protein
MKQLFIMLLLSVVTFTAAAQEKQCKGKKADGTPCKMVVGINKEGYCMHHNPNANHCEKIKANGERCKMVVKKDVKYCRFHKG